MTLNVLGIMTVAVLVLGSGQTVAQQEPGNAAAGRRLASDQCTACHAADRPAGPGDRASSFTEIARMPSTTSLSLRAFLLMSHPSMPNYKLTPEEVDDVVAYILTLRQH